MLGEIAHVLVLVAQHSGVTDEGALRKIKLARSRVTPPHRGLKDKPKQALRQFLDRGNRCRNLLLSILTTSKMQLDAKLLQPRKTQPGGGLQKNTCCGVASTSGTAVQECTTVIGPAGGCAFSVVLQRNREHARFRDTGSISILFSGRQRRVSERNFISPNTLRNTFEPTTRNASVWRGTPTGSAN
jgi:hypothetical protein